ELVETFTLRSELINMTDILILSQPLTYDELINPVADLNLEMISAQNCRKQAEKPSGRPNSLKQNKRTIQIYRHKVGWLFGV
ncbi:hypothetical protein AVEN_102356-2-1, partial [Araneus ventricosus]